MKEKVLEFINLFKQYESDFVLEKTFTCGFCYYFAVILRERFDGQILYDPVEGHFITKIEERYYDITGDITELYQNNDNLYTKDQYLREYNIVKGTILKYIYYQSKEDI